MDNSANSGSIQSSSGADEEYDSRADNSSSFSAFLNNNPTPHQNIFQLDNNDAFSNNFSHPRPNLDMVWSKSVRSEPNQHDLNTFVSSSPSMQLQPNQAFLLSQLSGHAFSTVPHQTLPRGGGLGGGQLLSVTPVNDVSAINHAHVNTTTTTTTTANAARNPKKRSRASRRAPTTVLTTDTTNFRAMVQEFTGIPAPPFTRPRLDLFNSGLTIRSSPLEPPPPPYLLRPFAQKLHTTFPNSSTANNSSTSINYPLSIQNPILNFQSILPNSVPQSSLGIPPTGVLLDVNDSDNNNNNTSILVGRNDAVVPSSNNHGRGVLSYAAPLDFRGEKAAPECAVAESWICSSD